ncbi:hypothetical protein SESBI_01641 [Sesbania bispinosa]|nr:hypothetical protein SESBI_01641 [Sesbania bispinosa]
MNKKDEESFLTKFANRTILSERIVDLNSLRNYGWDLYPYTNKQEIGSYFEREGFIYPKMVKAFYAASKVETSEDGSSWIRICLKGVEMKLNLTILYLVTDLKDHGSRLYDEVN